MLQYNQNLKSSRISPLPSIVHKANKPLSIYQNMLIEDMAASFSIEFGSRNAPIDFYKIRPSRSELNHLLCYKDPYFIKYEMDHLISRIVSSMVTSKCS